MAGGEAGSGSLAHPFPFFLSSRFTGTVTCYVDDATGDVVGLQFGAAPALCTNAGVPRSFVVPADGYIADMKIAVDPKTALIGEAAFVVKSNSSLLPTNVVTCGKKGLLGANVLPKMTAFSSATGACRPAAGSNGRRLSQGGVVGLDPRSLRVNVTTVPAGAIGGGNSPSPPGPPPGPRSLVLYMFGYAQTNAFANTLWR